MKFIKFDEINSTNEYLARKLNVEEYEVVIAKKQTNGRGKRGRVWISNEGAALFSFPIKSTDELIEKVTIFTGYIVYEVLKQYIKDEKKENLKFKWPNDLYYENKKICGILCEKVRENIIVGIGININNNDFGIYESNATSLLEIGGEKNDIDKIIEEIVVLFKENVQLIHKKWDSILKVINENNYLKNKKLKIIIDELYEEKLYKFIRIDRSGKICLLGRGDVEEKVFNSLDFKIVED